MVQSPKLPSFSLYEYNSIGGVLSEVDKIVFGPYETEKTYYMIAEEKTIPTVNPWWLSLISEKNKNNKISVTCDYYKNGPENEPEKYEDKGRFSKLISNSTTIALGETVDENGNTITTTKSSLHVGKDQLVGTGSNLVIDTDGNTQYSNLSDERGITKILSSDGKVIYDATDPDSVKYRDSEGNINILKSGQGVKVFLDSSGTLLKDAFKIFEDLHPVKIKFEKETNR